LGQIGNYLFEFISMVMAPKRTIAAGGENGFKRDGGRRAAVTLPYGRPGQVNLTCH
jgi:hypothetical protein